MVNEPSTWPPPTPPAAAAQASHAGLSSGPSLHERSQWLRESVADEQWRELHEQMTQLSVWVEAVLPPLRAADAAAALRLAQGLRLRLREHAPQVAEMGALWRAQPEHRAYGLTLAQWTRALDAVLALLEQGRLPDAAQVDALELAAWRAMSDAMLLSELAEPMAAAAAAAAEAASRPWWRRWLARWWRA